MNAEELLKNEFLNVHNKELIIDGCAVSSLIKEFGSPLYVYSEKMMDQQLNRVKKSLKDFEIYYSVKANPNPSIIQHFRDQGCGMEVASGGEIETVILSGCDPDRIFFAGPGKSNSELSMAIESGIEEIHLESLEEARRLGVICAEKNKKIGVSLRINPEDIGLSGGMQMGGKALAFGMDETLIFETLDEITKNSFLEFKGIHVYAGTQLLDPTVLLDIYTHTFKLGEKIINHTGEGLHTIDFGGGFGIPYFRNENSLDLETFGKSIQSIVEAYRKKTGFDHTRLVVEPGRFLTAPSGFYLTTIEYVKKSYDKTFAILSGGMNHHLSASGNLGQVIKRNYPIVIGNKIGEPISLKVDIAGPLCTPLDTLGRAVKSPELEQGDIVIVLQSGAYGLTASPAHFLSHNMPAEILVNSGKTEVIRKRGGVERHLAGTILDGK